MTSPDAASGVHVEQHPGNTGQWERIQAGIPQEASSRFSLDITSIANAAAGLGRFVRDVGIPGALLFVIAYAAIYHLPNIVTQIQEGYRELAAQHAAERKLDNERHDKQIDKLGNAIEKQATSTNSLVEEFRRDREFRRGLQK